MKTEFTLGETVTALADLFLPRVCAVCGRPLDVSERHLCVWCAADFPMTYYWQRTHNPMADRFNEVLQRWLYPGEGLSGGVLGEPDAVYGPYEPYAYAASLFFYRSEAEYKRIPQRIKYHSDLHAGTFFGRMLGERLAAGGPFSDVETVIPVPLHWTRYWTRGYNQAEVIASAVAEATGAVLRPDILYRVRKTRTQTRLGVEEKQANVADAFRIRPHVLPLLGREIFRHILLVDDVFTTGATLAACYCALRAAIPPPVRISVATLACVDR